MSFSPGQKKLPLWADAPVERTAVKQSFTVPIYGSVNPKRAHSPEQLLGSCLFFERFGLKFPGGRARLELSIDKPKYHLLLVMN